MTDRKHIRHSGFERCSINLLSYTFLGKLVCSSSCNRNLKYD